MPQRKLVTALAAAVALLLAIPALASADSIVYLKGGQVWIARADGSGARQFTVSPYGWKSPSEADDGTVVVAGGLARTNPGGTDSSGSSELYRFRGDGNQIGGPIPTYGSYSSPACPTYGPGQVRVAPDGSKIAYDIFECGSSSTTALWTPSTATGLSFPNQTQGQSGWALPAWIDSSRFVVSLVGPPFSNTDARWFVHPTSGGDYASAGAWSEPAMGGTGAQGVISRDGNTFVVFEDDAASWSDGRPRNLKLWVYTSPVNGVPVGSGWTPRCTVPLDAASTPSPATLSPSISADGSQVVWGDAQGVKAASIANPGDCSSIVPRLVIAGGSQPFSSRGELQPGAANPTQPGAGGSGGGGTPMLASVSRYTISPRSFRAASSGPSALASRRRKLGAKVAFRLNEAARVRFTVRQRATGRRGSRGRCVKPTRANRRGRRCSRFVTLRGSFTRNGYAGANSFRFTGRLRNRKLKPGRYQLVATPSASGRKGRASTASFRIKR